MTFDLSDFIFKSAKRAQLVHRPGLETRALSKFSRVLPPAAALQQSAALHLLHVGPHTLERWKD